MAIWTALIDNQSGIMPAQCSNGPVARDETHIAGGYPRSTPQSTPGKGVPLRSLYEQIANPVGAHRVRTRAASGNHASIMTQVPTACQSFGGPEIWTRQET